MKLPCKYCGEIPKYRYEGVQNGKKRLVYLECPNYCQVSRVSTSDPTALKYWNEENAR